MAASEHPARPKPAFVYMVRCTGGQLYTGWTNAPAARLQAHKSGRGARYTRARGAAALCLRGALCGQAQRPAAGSCTQKAAQGAKGAAVPRMERGGRALFRRIKTKRNPGLFQGQTAHKRVPGVLFLRCGPQPMGRAHKCRRRILCRETERPCRFARQGLSAFQGCFRITSGGSALPAGRSMP